MHEFAFAQSLVDAVLSEYAANAPGKGSVTAVTVVAGRLHQLVEDNLQMAFELLTRETVAAGARLILRSEEITYRCRDCGEEGVITPPLFLCNGCKSGKLEILSGKELYLEKMEIQRDE